jgi:hypothetical protein
MEQEPQPSRSEQIAQLNDDFRRSGRNIYLTDGIRLFSELDLFGLVRAVQDFTNFTEDIDPYHEHDFGKIIWGDEKTYWKIDYYDTDLQYYEDPLSPTCNRLLTIILAEEY